MTKKEDNHIKIDFSHKETEAGWLQLIDDFGRKAAPVWFNWIAWIFLLGLLEYLFKKSHSVIVGVTIGISYLLLLLYFQWFFCRIDFKNVPVLCRIQNKIFISVFLSVIMGFLFWKAAIQIAIVVSNYQS